MTPSFKNGTAKGSRAISHKIHRYVEIYSILRILEHTSCPDPIPFSR